MSNFHDDALLNGQFALQKINDLLNRVDGVVNRWPPAKGRRFYAIDEKDDGTVDVYLMPDVTIYPTEDGFREYDISVRIVRGVVPWDGLEEDIRARFRAWCENGEVIDL